jgi:dephospho-CoA kinase
MKLIGVTGNIASGKSTISKIISDHYGFPLISVDVFSKEWISLYSLGVRGLFQKYGIHEEKTVTDTLRKNFFKNIELKQTLEWSISEDFWRYISSIRDFGKYPVIVVEHPVMFDMDDIDKFDFIVGVATRTYERAHRMENRGYTLEQIIERNKAQTPFDIYEDLMDIVLDNTLPLTSQDVIYELSNSNTFKAIISESSLS